MFAKNKNLLGAIALILAERGLDVSGITNLPLAIILWGAAALLFLIWLWHSLPENPFQRKFMAPLILIAIGVACIGGGATWYFIKAHKSPTETKQLDGATTEHKDPIIAADLKALYQRGLDTHNKLITANAQYPFSPMGLLIKKVATEQEAARREWVTWKTEVETYLKREIPKRAFMFETSKDILGDLRLLIGELENVSR